MAYNVVLRRNGAKVGHFGPFTTKKQAIAQGQVLADDAARDVVVSVEPQRKKATTKKKRTNTRRTRKNTDPKPRVKPYTKSLSIGEDKADAREKAWLKKSYTVFLGSTVFSNGGGFDYWGNPATGRVIAVGVKGYSSSGFGDAGYWAGHVSRSPDVQTTEEGRNWNWSRFRTNTRRSNPGRGTFKSKVYAYYTVADGKLTSGHGSPTGTPNEKKKAREEAIKQANGNKNNVKTAKQAQKYVGRSLTSSAAWYNEPRRNPRKRKNGYHISPNEDPHDFDKPIVKKLRYMRNNPASKSILKRIDLANKFIAFAMKHDIRGLETSSTFTDVITYTHPIKVSAGKNRATVKYTENYGPGKKKSETFNLNDTDTYSDTGVSALRYAINTYIIKPIKRGAKDEGRALPASLR